jgi:lipid-binding SYLF domain-containing protein
MIFSTRTVLALLTAAAIMGGCSTAPKSASERASLQSESTATINRFKAQDPGMEAFFKDAQGYAVFPTVAKGGAIVGGAHGRGVLYEGGSAVGFCDLSQATFGLQLGGQGYSEVIFFQTQESLVRFKSGNFAFAAQASAVAATAGASADADYEDGVAVFTMEKGGLMYEASVGGQKFRYEPR